MIRAHSYKSWAGKTFVQVCHSRNGREAINGDPGTLTTLLTEPEAREMVAVLTAALLVRTECVDCGSTLHTVDDPSCRVSNREESE
jgi:hypothetical protein